MNNNDYITVNNVNSVQSLINQKNNTNPFFGTAQSAKKVINDMDHHPYTRFYRGVYYYQDPIIFEREAGWRIQENSCYSPNFDFKPENSPSNCFEVACSTVFPCYQSYLAKYADKEKLDVMLNNACIIEYR